MKLIPIDCVCYVFVNTILNTRDLVLLGLSCMLIIQECCSQWDIPSCYSELWHSVALNLFPRDDCLPDKVENSQFGTLISSHM